MVAHFRELRVYRRAFLTARTIFEASKHWPTEEQYALTDQIRRSSRSVCANVAEAWRKRRYPNHFISKLSDADAEAAETQTWIDFVLDCGYMNQDTRGGLDEQYEVIIGGLVKMMDSAEQWCGPAKHVREEMSAYFAAAQTPTPPNAQTP
jgi:four helix bundle protein